MNKFRKVVNEGLVEKLNSIRHGAFETLVIVESASADGYAEISIPNICKLSGHSRRKIHECLNALEDAGYIKRELAGFKYGEVQIYKILKSVVFDA
jgi:predicted transcriptional regulator